MYVNQQHEDDYLHFENIKLQKWIGNERKRRKTFHLTGQEEPGQTKSPAVKGPPLKRMAQVTTCFHQKC